MSRVVTERREGRSAAEQQDKDTLTSTFDERHSFQLTVFDIVSKGDVRLVAFDRKWLSENDICLGNVTLGSWRCQRDRL
jgi:hypothetical protein